MVTCPNCEHENRTGAGFCDTCGTPLTSDRRGSEGRSCDNCGAPAGAASRFCDNCGAEIVAGSVSKARVGVPPVSGETPAFIGGGRYRLDHVLGEGGKKRVFLATDTALDRQVAVAVLKTEGMGPNDLLRLQREAQAMGRLGDHPHVVQIYDIGEEGGAPYIVSQYMRGGDVEGLMREAPDRRLELEWALAITSQTASALAYAHKRGIIHRDLKPGNVWLTEDRLAKLGDFGLAITLDRSRITMAGMMVGTAAYMPPEVAMGGGRDADERSDIYSLGCMLYEMLTGRPPFAGREIEAVVSQHINNAPVAPSRENPAVPQAVDGLVMKMLAKSPGERPQSADEVGTMIAAIEAVARGSSELTLTATAASKVTALSGRASDLSGLTASTASFTGGTFVGRGSEMSELCGLLEEAAARTGKMAVVSGEAGSGKTRLLDEVTTYAELRGLAIYAGRCYEGEGAPCYWPWVQIIKAYSQDRDGPHLLGELGPGAAEIAQVVPDIKERVDLGGFEPPPSLDAEQARFRLFESVTEFFRRASSRQPLLLIFDDLQWADRGSLLLLRHIARELRSIPLMILITYREEEVGAGNSNSDLYGDIAREAMAKRIRLNGFTVDEIADFIQGRAGFRPPVVVTEFIARETEGNPFFVSELVELLIQEEKLTPVEDVSTAATEVVGTAVSAGTAESSGSWSVGIPQGVREVVRHRLDRLSEDARTLLTVSAVIGREFGLDLLEQVTDFTGDELIDLIEGAINARVIEEMPRPAGSYRFSHALTREILYDALTSTRRIRMHRRIAEALESINRGRLERHLPELAYHFSQAAPVGEVEKAVTYSQMAAEYAEQLPDFDQAITLYDYALSALSETGDRSRKRGELLIAKASAQQRAGLGPAARETSVAAATLARELGAYDLLARAALIRGSGLEVSETGKVDEETIRDLEDALAGLEQTDSSLRVEVMARLSMELYYSPHSETRRDELSLDALEAARRLGEPDPLVAALASRRFAMWAPERLEERLAGSREIVKVAGECRNRERQLQGQLWELIDLLEMGDVTAAKQVLDDNTRLAEAVRQPTYVRWTLVVQAGLALLEGRFAECEKLANEAFILGERGGNPSARQFWAIQMFALRREQGRLQELEAGIKTFVERFPLIPAWRAGLAYVYGELDRREEASAEFETLASDGFDWPHDRNWLIGFNSLSEVCAYLGDRERAGTIYAKLLPFAAMNAVVGPGAVSYGSVSRNLGLLASLLGRYDDAERHFHHAIEMHEQMGALVWLAHSKAGYASMLLARNGPGDLERAAALEAEALETYTALEMKPFVERISARPE